MTEAGDASTGARRRASRSRDSLDAEPAPAAAAAAQPAPTPTSSTAPRRTAREPGRDHNDRSTHTRTFPFARSMSSAAPPQASTSKSATRGPTSPRPSLASHSRPSYIRLPPRQGAPDRDRAGSPSPDVTSPSGRFSVSSADSSAGSRVNAPDLGGSSARYFPIRSVMYPSTGSAGSRGSRSGSTAMSAGSTAPPESAEALLSEGFPTSPREQDEEGLDFGTQSFSVPIRDAGRAMKQGGMADTKSATSKRSRPDIRPLPDRGNSSDLTEGGGRSETSGYSSFETQSDAKPPSLDPFLPEPTTHAKIGDPDSDDDAPMEGLSSGRAGSGPRSDVQEHDFEEGTTGLGLSSTRRTGASRMLNPNETRYENAAREAGSTAGSNQSYVMTSRFEHKVTDDGEHLILTGREGELQRCEDEPIHAPGAIQAFGVLIAFDLKDDDRMIVQQVSENSNFVIGITPRSLFRANCLSEILGEEEADVLLDAIDALDERDADETNEEVGPYTFVLSGEGEPGSGAADAHARDRLHWSCHAAIHRPNVTQRPERLILELELIDDQVNPLTTRSEEPVSPDERGGMGGPDDYGENGINPTEEDLIESTVSIIKPLRQLSKNKSTRTSRRRAARRGGGRGDDKIDVVGLLSQINDQLSKADDLETFLKVTAGIFRELTEFDRVMIYQFDECWNGRVVAEQVDWSRTKDLFRGLSFPASDIPAQARELYKINKVRVLYDRDQPTARLCCRSIEEVNDPLDMTHCHLRAMSPIHIKYLGNMGVRASTSISITAFGDLWGLVAMHTYGRYGHRVSFRVRQFCKLLGQSVSRNIERISYASRLQARKLINTATTEQNPSGYIVAKAEDLLDLFHADFGVLSIGEEAKILGAISNSQELLALLEYLRACNFKTLVSSQDIKEDFPDIDYPDGFRVVAGILVVPLSAAGNDFIVFCRKGQLQEVHWAGNPHANKTVGADDYRPLEPRKSFKIWSETIVGKSRAWTDEEKETASVLCLVYGKFIAVWREKESALAASQLKNLLLANASHEVRTPLNAIINYLELALDGPIQGEVRDNLVRSHAASKSLIHVINDLLDLTRTEKGNDLFLTDPFNIAETLEEAVAMHRDEASRRGLSLDVVENPSGTPQTVLGDRAKIRQIVTNVVANSLKHTEEGGILVEWGEVVDDDLEDAVEAKREGIRIGISISDTGHGISEQKLENIFRQLENVSTIGDRERDERAESEQAVGLGLAVVARIVRNLDGQLQVESKVGQGSKFTFIFPFRLPPSDAGSTTSKGSKVDSPQHALETVPTSAALDRRKSTTSAGSTGSRASKASSEIDSLINAISVNHMADSPPGPAAPTHTRSIGNRSMSSLSAGARSRGGQSAGNRSLESRSAGSARSAGSFRTAASTQAIKGDRNDAGAPPGSVEIRNSAVPLRASRVPGGTASPMVSPNLASARHAGPPLTSPFFPGNDRQLPPPTPSSSAGGTAEPEPSREETTTPRPASPSDAKQEASTRRKPDASAPEGESARASKVEEDDSIQPMRVLVVEDEMVNRMIISQRLKKDGHEVVVAEHGGAAVRKFEEDRNFDVVLMDLQMPIMNGIDASRNIRRVEGEHPLAEADQRITARLNRGIPIFAVTASLPERERHTIVDAQLDGWLLKPIDFKRLRTLLRGATDQEVRHRELYRPGQWERGGWLADAPEREAPPTPAADVEVAA